MATLRIDRSNEERSGSGKLLKAVIILIVLAALGGGEYYFWNSRENGGGSNWSAMTELLQKRPEFRITRASVEKGRSADATVVATGYLKSRRQAKIGARAPGRIQVVNVEEGTVVTNDEILAILEHADLDASLAASRACLARARAAVREQEVLIDQAGRSAQELSPAKLEMKEDTGFDRTMRQRQDC